ncbi:MAG: hypothetical protein QOK19_2256 [Solirubrobacteraceae bacterium]|jgi:hypothetical protein|nr:hypothetical protein [Solirubrobacterales bacterium]MEA2216695.1 hypothetical protein [Solirubrobacteraceae bacterium]
MTDAVRTDHPPDICLLLRVHAEQRWLISKVIPVIRQLEQPDAVAADDHGAAVAYLEVLWLEAGLRAAETDTAAAKLDPDRNESSTLLSEKADRYHAAVRRLRHAVDRRVRNLTALTPEQPAPEPTGP